MAIAEAGHAETQEALERALLERERERREALVASDAERFADIIADDIVHVHTTGIVQNKAELIGHGTRILQFHAIERGPLTIRRLAPGVAVMTGPMTNLVGKRGTPDKVEVKAFVTQIWAHRDGRWQIASFHAVRLPDA